MVIVTRSKAEGRRSLEKNRDLDDGRPVVQKILPVVLLASLTLILLWYIVHPRLGSDQFYIDEEFHVPQAQRYCRGQFKEWDQKITTLPGIYLLSSIILVPFMKMYTTLFSWIGILDNGILQNYEPCSLFALRALNAVGAPACLYYAYQSCQLLLSKNEIKKPGMNIEISYIILAMSVATFPVIYAPYSMLYYTDAWATASVFLWYSSHLNKKTNFWIKIVSGGFCVLCRQTNIAWLVFASIIDVCYCVEQCFPIVKNNVSTFSYIKVSMTQLYKCCSIKKKNKIKKLIDFLQKCWYATSHNIIVIGIFIVFVVFLNNGDIVVGDRRAHIPHFHPMQLCYFIIFLLSFSLPWYLSQAYFNIQTYKFTSKQLTISKKIKSIPKMIMLITIISGLVYLNTIAHPYLLADNRHYMFYAWRLLFGPGKPVFFRYLPVPVYAYGLYFVDSKLSASSIVYKLAFWMVTPLVLCLQFLLEPRYFVVPYLMYRLHSNIIQMNSSTIKSALIEFTAYQICNFVIMWIFLCRPFISTMDNTGRIDRFTW